MEKEAKKKGINSLRELKQRDAINSISSGIWKTSTEFDLDDEEDTPLDRLIGDKCLLKSLETDNLIFMEGRRSTEQPDFITAEEFQEEVEKKENWDVISAGDYQEEFDEMFDEIENRTRPKLDSFDTSKYFERIFPSLRIQKPGYDLYLT